MIVDSGREAPAGASGSMSSPLNLAYFYGASPYSSDASCSPPHSAPGSPGSDSQLSSCSSSSSGERDSLDGACHALQEHHMGGGKQHRGPFQGVRVKNSVKELLLHIRSNKQMSSGHGADEFKAQEGLNYEQFTELNIFAHSGKRKAHEPLSDGPSYKRPATFHTHLLTPPQTPTSMDNMEDAHKNEPKHNGSDMLQNIMNIKNESNPISLNTVQVSWLHTISNHNSPGERYQDIQGAQVFSPSQKYHALQASSPPQMLDSPQNYQFSSSQTQDLPQNYTRDSLLEYSPFSGNDQSPTYQQNVFESHKLQYCPAQSFASLLNDSEGSENLSNCHQPLATAHQQPDGNTFPQNFSLVPSNSCSTLDGHSSPLATFNLSLQHQGIVRNTAQLGKSFFQWQVEQEENKLANISQEQILAKDSDGDTFLHIAVAQGRRALSYVLARKMAALHMLDIKEHNGQSAFQVAVAANQHLIVQDLVSLGAQVNTTDCWGRTPLHVCAEKGYSQVLQAIQKGAIGSSQYMDIEATNYDGLTALHCAVLTHNAVVHELRNSQPPHSPEAQELLLKNKSLVDTIKFLVQMGASVEAKDRKSGRSALHLAAEEANLELIRFFLDLPNCLSFVNAKAYSGNTALHVAASLQYRVTQLDAVRLLMRKGADPSARNLENEQPVHLVPDGPVGEQIRRILKGKAVQQRASPY